MIEGAKLMNLKETKNPKSIFTIRYPQPKSKDPAPPKPHLPTFKKLVVQFINRGRKVLEILIKADTIAFVVFTLGGLFLLSC